MSNREQDRPSAGESEKTKSQERPVTNEPGQSELGDTEADDITIGDEAQKQREKISGRKKLRASGAKAPRA